MSRARTVWGIGGEINRGKQDRVCTSAGQRHVDKCFALLVRTEAVKADGAYFDVFISPGSRIRYVSWSETLVPIKLS